MQLNHLQAQFIHSIREGADAPGEFLALIENANNFPATERLALYASISRNAYKKALAETYQTCRKILGDQYFNQMTGVYIKQTASLNPDLNQYGHDFPEWLSDFIQHHEELSDYPYLPDLAKLEWFRQSAFYAEDVTLFNFQALLHVDEKTQSKIVFKINPALFLLKSDYPIYEIWRVNNLDEFEQSDIKANSDEQYICTTRHDLIVNIQLLEQKEFELLRQIQEEVTFAELQKKHEKNDCKLDTVLPLLIKKNMISDFYLAI